MQNPSKLLEKLLSERGVEKSALGRELGGGYQRVQRWCRGAFPADAQLEVARYFGLPADYFADHAHAERTRALQRAAWEAFSRSELGRTAQRHELEILERVSFGDHVPRPALYAAWLLAMRGQLDGTPEDSAAENAALEITRGDSAPDDARAGKSARVGRRKRT